MSEPQLLNILIVDDSRMTRGVIKQVLETLDLPIAKMYEAADGAEGIQCLQSAPIDLVMADLNMPVMDGFELIQRMRAHPVWVKTPVVVISAQPDPEQTELLKRQGVAAYLAKPFTQKTSATR